MKEELLSQPIFGWFIRHIDVVALDRKAGLSSLKKLLVDSQAKADQGLPVVIFPEGTRTRPGERGRYHPGVAAMYEKLNLPVVPVGTDSGVFWDQGLKGLKQGVITVAIQPAIQPGLDKRAFLTEVSECIETSSLSLFEQAQIRGLTPDVDPNESAKVEVGRAPIVRSRLYTICFIIHLHFRARV